MFEDTPPAIVSRRIEHIDVKVSNDLRVKVVSLLSLHSYQEKLKGDAGVYGREFRMYSTRHKMM